MRAGYRRFSGVPSPLRLDELYVICATRRGVVAELAAFLIATGLVI